MTPEQLKASILQLAIQGKLVPQRPEEGTAEELYQQIQREKKNLIAAGKLKKEKPLTPISEDEIPFDIPDSWKWLHLDNIAQTALGKTLDKYKNTGDYHPYLCSINVYWSGIDLSKVKEARFENDELSKYRLKKGDLLICEGGDAGRTAIWESDTEMYYQNALHRVRFYGGISPYFYKYLLEYYGAAGILKAHCKGQTIKHLVQKSLCSMWLPMPPIAEQQRIVEKIEQMLPLVEQYGEAYTALESLDARFPEDMRKSILQYAIQGKLVPQSPEEGTAEELYQQIQKEKKKLIAAGKLKKEKPLPPISEEEIPFDIPESWKWVRLQSICSRFSTGPFGTMLHKCDYSVRGIPVVNPTNIIDGSIVTKKVERISEETRDRLAAYKLNVGDIVLARRGNLAKSAAVGKNENGWLCGTGSFMIHPIYVSTQWFCHLYVSQYVQSYLLADSVGTTMNNLNQGLLGKLPIPLPPLAEQQRIVEKIEQMLLIIS